MLINRPTIDPTVSPLLGAFVFLGTGGAVRIKPRWAITAAHCAPPPTVNYPEVHRHPSLDLALLRLRDRSTGFVGLLEPEDRPVAAGESCEVMASGWYGTGDANTGTLRLTEQHRIALGRNAIDLVTPIYHVLDFDDIDNECAIQAGDSGGGVIVRRGALCVLAGVLVSGDTGSPPRAGARSYAVRLDTEPVAQWIATVTGDHDGDGDVDARDMNIVAARYGQRGYDAATFNALVAHYGD